MVPRLLKILSLLDEVFRNQDQGTPASNRTVSAADVVLYGVNIVLPLMSQDLLKVNVDVFWCLTFDPGYTCPFSVAHRTGSVSMSWSVGSCWSCPRCFPVPLSVQPVLQTHHLHLWDLSRKDPTAAWRPLQKPHVLPGAGNDLVSSHGLPACVCVCLCVWKCTYIILCDYLLKVPHVCMYVHLCVIRTNSAIQTLNSQASAARSKWRLLSQRQEETSCLSKCGLALYNSPVWFVIVGGDVSQN